MLDYDDTHMGGVVLHASSPILAALFALAERGGLRRPRADLRLCRRASRPACASGSRRPAITTAAGISPARSARSRPAPRAAKLLGLDAQQMTHALGIAGDAGGGHAAEPRHHVQVVPCRQGGVERAARRAAGAAGLRQLGGDRSRASAASRASTARRRRPRSCSTSSARAGRSPATATSPMPAAWCCIRSSTPWSRSASSARCKPDEIARVEVARASDRGAHHRARRSRDRAAIEVQHLSRGRGRLSRPRRRHRAVHR